ncbi:MAG: hypothetical protein Q9184_001343 [Pyrenodesmia sp. 2 TL-2023]
MPSSPRTPNRQPKSSTLTQPYSSPPRTQDSPSSRRSVRRLSTCSFSSPTSIESAPLRDDRIDFGPSNGPDDVSGDSNGLGNLADELAEAWDDVDEVPQVPSPVTHIGENGAAVGLDVHRGRPTFEIHHDMGFGLPIAYDGANDNRSLSPPKQLMSSRPKRKTPNMSDYDGSDYGDNTDFEIVEGISASLEHRLSAIESLARRGTEVNGSGSDEVVIRVVQSLRDLGFQAGVETSATRLMTAHTAVASNLAHQTRLVQTLSHHFVSPFSTPPALEETDSLLPMLAATLDLLPPLNPRVIASLHSLHTSTAELITRLSTLADNLNMLRQTTSLASRKLKVAKDLVDELRKEAELRHEGIKWVEAGNWDARLSNRECKTICGDVVDGFRVVCEKWERTIQENAMGQQTMEVAAG